VPFERNIGSASAMLGFLQIGISSLASASVGLFASHTMLPIAAVMTATSWIGLPNRVEKFLASQARHRMFSGRAALPRSPNQSRRRSLQRPPSTAQPV